MSKICHGKPVTGSQKCSILGPVTVICSKWGNCRETTIRFCSKNKLKNQFHKKIWFPHIGNAMLSKGIKYQVHTTNSGGWKNSRKILHGIFGSRTGLNTLSGIPMDNIAFPMWGNHIFIQNFLLISFSSKIGRWFPYKWLILGK